MFVHVHTQKGPPWSPPWLSHKSWSFNLSHLLALFLWLVWLPYPVSPVPTGIYCHPCLVPLRWCTWVTLTRAIHLHASCLDHPRHPSNCFSWALCPTHRKFLVIPDHTTLHPSSHRRRKSSQTLPSVLVTNPPCGPDVRNRLEFSHPRSLLLFILRYGLVV